MSDENLKDQLNNHGAACIVNKQWKAALIAFKQALALSPKDPQVLTNVGAAYWNLMDLDSANSYFQKAIDLDKTFAPAWSNLSLLHSANNDWQAAEICINKAIELDPDKLEYSWDAMILKLDRGDWKKGLHDYSVRKTYKKHEYPELPYPLWNGEDLGDGKKLTSGKTLFIQTEQGIGDRVMVSRYLPLIKKHYPLCKIIVLTEDFVIPLLWQYRLDGIIDEFIPFGVPYPKADYGCYMMDLIRIFGTHSQHQAPKLTPHIKNYADSIKHLCNIRSTQPASPKIGIVWSGNPEFLMNHWRSIPFELFVETLCDSPNYTFVSLQGGEAAKELQKSGLTGIIYDLSPKLLEGGWNMTLAAISNLDLIITVDTAVAHIAGSLEKPVWTILNKASYWPYGRTETSLTGWYPSMKLFRQTKIGDWKSVLSYVKAELELFRTKFNTPNLPKVL